MHTQRGMIPFWLLIGLLLVTGTLIVGISLLSWETLLEIGKTIFILAIMAAMAIGIRHSLNVHDVRKKARRAALNDQRSPPRRREKTEVPPHIRESTYERAKYNNEEDVLRNVTPIRKT